MANPTTSRGLQDALMSVSVALPFAANTANTNGIDLGSTSPYPVTEKIVVQLTNTIATQANSKNINVVLQDSADNSTFANIALLGPAIITGNAANVIPNSYSFSLPPGVRRYIRASATGEANGGNSADGTLTVKLLF